MDIVKNICQICQLKSVAEDAAETVIEEDNGCLLSELFGNEIVEEMLLNSSAICTECWNIIRQFHDLYEKVQDQFQNYKNLIATQNFIKEEPIITLSSLPVCKLENININTENIDDDDDDIDDNAECYDNFDNYNDISDDDNQISITSSIVAVNKMTSPSKLQRSLKPPKSSSKQKPLKSKTISRSKIVKNKLNQPMAAKTKEELYAENKQIKEYFKMICDICDDNYKFETIAEARKHYRQNHKQNGYISCCNRKFFRRIRILEHINAVHIKSKTFRCDKCDKDFADIRTYRNHMENHAPPEDRPFKCDICKNGFMKLYKLTQHMQSAHIANMCKVKSFNCEQCGNKFYTNGKLNTHIRVVHNNVYAQMCEICARIFKSKSALDAHLLEHTNIEQPKVQCTMCGSWLKNEQSLKKHIDLHNDGVQVCTICNKEAPNKSALRNHMRYVHREAKHKCSICDKAFKQPIGLREHMALHTGQDLYTCTYCPKTFKSGANMHSHRKKVHPIEWINDRKKK